MQPSDTFYDSPLSILVEFDGLINVKDVSNELVGRLTWTIKYYPVNFKNGSKYTLCSWAL
jgi:hypothetical protein